MDSDTLIGLIFMLVLGPAVGNYACSVVYRMPRGQTPFEKKPYCGHCGEMLQPRDLFPIISYLMTKGKCRFCGDPIRMSYLIIELLCLVVFITNFLVFGMSEEFLLFTAFSVFLIILVMIDFHEGFISSFMYVLAFCAMAIIHSIHIHTIYPWLQSGFVCLFGAAILWQATRKGQGTLPEVPHWVWLSGLMGVSFPLFSPGMPRFAVVPITLAVLLYGVQRAFSRWRSTSPAICTSIYVCWLLLWFELQRP